jgi:hypothetical protein
LTTPLRLGALLAALLALAAAPAARARVTNAESIDNAELVTITGGKELLLARVPANIVLFWRSNHERSLDTLKQLAACEKAFEGKPVHIVAVVSGSQAAADVKADVAASGLRSPVLIDQGDALYGKLEIRQHPVVIIADEKGKIAVAQTYVRLRYCDIIKAHVQYLLKEIDQAGLTAALNPKRATFPSEDPHNVARRYVRMGQKAARAGHCDQAVQDFDKALALEKDEPDALAGKAACLAAAKK